MANKDIAAEKNPEHPPSSHSIVEEIPKPKPKPSACGQIDNLSARQDSRIGQYDISISKKTRAHSSSSPTPIPTKTISLSSPLRTHSASHSKVDKNYSQKSPLRLENPIDGRGRRERKQLPVPSILTLLGGIFEPPIPRKLQ